MLEISTASGEKHGEKLWGFLPRHPADSRIHLGNPTPCLEGRAYKTEQKSSSSVLRPSEIRRRRKKNKTEVRSFRDERGVKVVGELFFFWIQPEALQLPTGRYLPLFYE